MSRSVDVMLLMCYRYSISVSKSFANLADNNIVIVKSQNPWFVCFEKRVGLVSKSVYVCRL